MAVFVLAPCDAALHSRLQVRILITILYGLVRLIGIGELSSRDLGMVRYLECRIFIWLEAIDIIACSGTCFSISLAVHVFWNFRNLINMLLVLALFLSGEISRHIGGLPFLLD